MVVSDKAVVDVAGCSGSATSNMSRVVANVRVVVCRRQSATKARVGGRRRAAVVSGWKSGRAGSRLTFQSRKAPRRREIATSL